MELWELLLILLVGIKALTVIEGRPSVTEAESPSDKAYLEADQFLTSYGYYPASEPLPSQEGKPSLRKHSDTERTKALKLFQKFYHLPQSGQLDKETKELMQSHRCGHPDIKSNPNAKGAPTGFEMEEEVSQSRKENRTEDRDELGMSMNRKRRSLGLPRKRLDEGKVLRDKDGNVYRWEKKKVYKWITDPKTGKAQRVLDESNPSRWRMPIMTWSIPPHHETGAPTEQQRFQILLAVIMWGFMVPIEFVEQKFDARVLARALARSDMILDMEPFTHEGLQHMMHETYGPWIHEEGSRKKLTLGLGKPKPKDGPKRKDIRHAHALRPRSKSEATSYKVNNHRLRLIHFDANHKWTDQELLSTALHEIGHALGLAHSDDPSAIMYAYNRNSTAFTIADLNSIDMIYGPPSLWFQWMRSGVCTKKLNNVDAIFMDPINSYNLIFPYYYVISGNYVERFLPPGILSNKAPIAEVFPGAPSDYDVVFSDTVSKCVFFIKGKTLYPYKNNKKLPTKQLHLPDIPITVAVTIEHYYSTSEEMTRTLLFGGKKSWVFEFDGVEPTTKSNRIYPEIIYKLLVPDTKYAVQWPRGGPVFAVKENAWHNVYGYVTADFGKNSTTMSLNPDLAPFFYMKRDVPRWIMYHVCGISHATCNRMSSASLVLVTILSLIRLY